MANGTLKVSNIQTSSGSGTITIGQSGETVTIPSGVTMSGMGKVLQVVNNFTSTQVTSSSTSLVDVGLSASITPSSASSKILIIAFINGVLKENGNSVLGVKTALLRDTTILKYPSIEAGWQNTTTYIDVGSVGITYLDSPATTSAITYKTQFSAQNASANVTVQSATSTSTITLMEIAG